MVKPLDGQTLETYFCRLDFKEETQKLIELIRSSPPSRDLREIRGDTGIWYPARRCQALSKLKVLGSSFHGFWRLSTTRMPLSI